MKLVIQTQYKENYGFHDWDGKGECPQYWKFKGGDTYVVNNLSSSSINKIAQEGIPTLTKLIEYSNEASKEYILDWEIVEDDAVVCREWENPIEFQYIDGKWTCLKFFTNDEYGYMRKEILAKSEQWTPLKDGERTDYECQYKVKQGWFDGNDPKLKELLN